jgi:AraC-like DNA-binding protein
VGLAPPKIRSNQSLREWVEESQENRDYFELLIETPNLTIAQIAKLVGSNSTSLQKYMVKDYWDVMEARRAWRHKFVQAPHMRRVRVDGHPPFAATKDKAVALQVLLRDPNCTLRAAGEVIGISGQYAYQLACRYFPEEYHAQGRKPGGYLRKKKEPPPAAEPVIEEGELPPGVVRLTDYLL